MSPQPCAARGSVDVFSCAGVENRMSYYVDPTVGSPSTFSAPHPAVAVSDGLFPASFPYPPSLLRAFLLAPGLSLDLLEEFYYEIMYIFCE